MHIGESVKPVVQPVIRIPFNLRVKVDEKLDGLLTADIIEEVPNSPTTWVSPLVVPKRNSEVRVCVKMR